MPHSPHTISCVWLILAVVLFIPALELAGVVLKYRASRKR